MVRDSTLPMNLKSVIWANKLKFNYGQLRATNSKQLLIIQSLHSAKKEAFIFQIGLPAKASL